ncbi:MAG: hydrogenase maturation protease [Firmicutes bacterium]|nr:hydrogenase maturation protease [Bacillota bacterium]
MPDGMLVNKGCDGVPELVPVARSYEIGSMMAALSRRLQGVTGVALLGVGNRARQDDGAGPAVVRQVKRIAGAVRGLLVVDCGERPEDMLDHVVDARPSSILWVDAVDLREQPGTYFLLEPDQGGAGVLSTHRIPIGLISRLMRPRTGADIAVLGIQIESCALGAPMSAPVVLSCYNLSLALSVLFKNWEAGALSGLDGPGGRRHFSNVPQLVSWHSSAP